MRRAMRLWRSRAGRTPPSESERGVGMLSESARMSTAREAAFRVDYPNSKPRVIKVIALDELAAEVVGDTARQQDWQNATFFTGLTANWDPKRPWGTPIHASL